MPYVILFDILFDIFLWLWYPGHMRFYRLCLVAFVCVGRS